MGIASVVNSYLISSGIRDKYKALDLTKLRYLAIVVESEEACHTSKVCELLQWLEAIGLKQVCLYDAEGRDLFELINKGVNSYVIGILQLRSCSFLC